MLRNVMALRLAEPDPGRAEAWDLVAIIDDDADALTSVVAHPDHAAFVDEMRHLWADRMVVDVTP
ncbi:MAG: Dabb family protein [Microbacterium sp.]